MFRGRSRFVTLSCDPGPRAERRESAERLRHRRWLYGTRCAVDGTQITDNQATGSGGGLYVASSSPVPLELTLENATILRNTAPQGGGVQVLDALLDSVACDWGTDGDDNAPDDVQIGSVSSGGYGADATFRCADEVCDPMP